MGRKDPFLVHTSRKKSRYSLGPGNIRQSGSCVPLPYYEIKESHKDITEEIESISWYFHLSGRLFPNFYASWLTEAILEAMFGTAWVILGCKIYKNQKGHFPDKIVDLVPDILDKEHLDPCTGNPLIYKIQEEGFIVYSLNILLKTTAEIRERWADPFGSGIS